jgi:phage terminase small subunit
MTTPRPSRTSPDYPLNARQQRFVDAYLHDPCAKTAAVRAGYTGWAAAQVGYQLLQRANVRAALEAARGAERGPVTRAQVIEELRHIAFANLMDYVQVNPRGGRIDLNLSTLNRAQAAGFREIVVRETYNNKTGLQRRNVSIRMGNKIQALTRLLAQLPPERGAPPASSALQGGFSETTTPLHPAFSEPSSPLHRGAGSND